MNEREGYVHVSERGAFVCLRESCVCMRERERDGAYVYVHRREGMFVSMRERGYVCINEREGEIHFCINERGGHVCLPVSEGYGLSLGKRGLFVVTGECGTVVPCCDVFVTTVRLWLLPL